MTNIENYLSLARRTGYEKVPMHLNFCPSLKAEFDAYCKETGFTVTPFTLELPAFQGQRAAPETFLPYYDRAFKPGTEIDAFGVAREPGSEAAFHMTKMYHPLAEFDSIEQLQAYPFPDYSSVDVEAMRREVEAAHEKDLIAIASLGSPIWESAWYMRSMEELMADMMMEDPMAEYLLDKVTDIAVHRARAYAAAGADVLYFGDDVGMQRTIMMSESLYCTWLKPRLARLIRAAKAVKPDMLVIYHSCGYVTPLIHHFMEAGIDVLNPVQPECMDFREIHEMFGDRLSFHGTIGTQTTMPFGTPEEVRREVFQNLEIAGDKGGLLVCPTHMLEPEVPVENVVAYIRACRDFK